VGKIPLWQHGLATENLHLLLGSQLLRLHPTRMGDQKPPWYLHQPPTNSRSYHQQNGKSVLVKGWWCSTLCGV